MSTIAEWMIENRPKPTNWKGEWFRYAQEKKDGVRLTLIRERDGSFRALQRKIYRDCWDQLSRTIRDAFSCVPSGTAIDGELTCDGNATEVASCLAHDPDRLRFTGFAVPWWAGEDWTRNCLDEAIGLIIGVGFAVPRTVDPDCDMMRTIRDRGWEGLVLKATHWHGWWKVKPFRTVDAVVTAWEPGKPGTQYADGMGALCVALYGPQGPRPLARVGGGYSAQQRRSQEFQGAAVGRVMEVAYDKVDGRGGLRFPRFLRWRDDKPMEECTEDQLSCE